MPRALRMPVEGGVYEAEAPDDDPKGLAALANAEWLDFVTVAEDGFQIAVSDTGLLDGLPLNQPATALAHEYRRLVYLCGDALVIGVNAGGEMVDVPAALRGITLSAGGL